MSISSIEDLSNEFFFEIFEYLDGCTIYQAFSDLNHRFQQLLNSSFLLYKVKDYYPTSFKKIEKTNYNEIMLHHKSQILFIELSETMKDTQIISSFTVDSTFNRLESLDISDIEPDFILSLLPKLADLPRLFSLKIDTWSFSQDLGPFYQLIFNLPHLKYIKYTIFDSEDSSTTISIPLATKEQTTSIEYFVINHFCPYDKFSNLLSYTPNLRYLNYLNLYGNNVDLQTIQPVTFSNLTHLSIKKLSDDV